MTQKVLFDVVSRPKKETAGLMTVINAFYNAEGDEIDRLTIGQLTKLRGADGYTASVVDESVDGGMRTLEGIHETRSKGGHAVQRAFYAEERAAKEAERAEKAAAREQAKAERAAAKAAKETKEAEGVTLDEAAESLGVTKRTVKRQIDAGKLLTTGEGDELRVILPAAA